MESNKFLTVEKFEQRLDCVIALHNLRQLRKLIPGFDIPPRRAAVPGEHIFKPKIAGKDVNLKIPADQPDLDLEQYRHIRDFVNFLPSAVPAMKKAMKLAGDDGVFFPTVRKRGENLYNGACVLQLQVQRELLDVWTVKYLVGASYSYETHSGYVEMSRDNAVKRSICDCFSG